jgi:hypothetical protein
MIAIRYPLVPRRPSGEHFTLVVAAARVGLHIDRLAALQRELTWLRQRG